MSVRGGIFSGAVHRVEAIVLVFYHWAVSKLLVYVIGRYVLGSGVVEHEVNIGTLMVFYVGLNSGKLGGAIVVVFLPIAFETILSSVVFVNGKDASRGIPISDNVDMFVLDISIHGGVGDVPNFMSMIIVGQGMDVLYLDESLVISIMDTVTQNNRGCAGDKLVEIKRFRQNLNEQDSVCRVSIQGIKVTTQVDATDVVGADVSLVGVNCVGSFVERAVLLGLSDAISSDNFPTVGIVYVANYVTVDVKMVYFVLVIGIPISLDSKRGYVSIVSKLYEVVVAVVSIDALVRAIIAHNVESRVPSYILRVRMCVSEVNSVLAIQHGIQEE